MPGHMEGAPLMCHWLCFFLQKAKMVELNIELSGSDSYAARFGESIANLGDIDNDGFEGKK